VTDASREPRRTAPSIGYERTLEFTAALDCVKRQLPVFPCRAKNKPLTEHGFKDASCEPAQVTDWWSRHPEAAVAVATGRPSQLLVLDVDGEDGAAALAELERAHGALPPTVSSVTPRGGRHYWFRYPDGRAVPCSAGKIGRGLDVRGDGGYVIMPPSKGPNGNRYTWHEPLGAAPIAAAPGWLVELALQRGRRNGPAPPVEGPIPQGERNTTLMSVAGSLRQRGLDQATISATLAAVNRERCRPPLPDAEVERIAASVARYPPGERAAELESRASRPDASATSPAEELAELLVLPEGVTVASARIVGHDSRASADICFSDGSRVTFETLSDFANPNRLAVQMAAAVGVTPIRKRPEALRALVLLRAIAQREETITADDVAIEWGVTYLQSAETLDLDIDDQAARWAAFERLERHDPWALARERACSLAHEGLVLVHDDGTRFVRCGWFHAFARSQDVNAGSNADVAQRMERVGWRRRGKRGRIKATPPGRPGQLAWSFFVVERGWEAER
jgi:bifunctional DNA primase/polymerase-like protein/primase-like protein